MQAATRILALALGMSAALPAAAADGVAATVNGQKIPQAHLDARVAEQKARGAPESPALINVMREDLINGEVAVQEARRAGLDKNPMVAAQAELAYRGVLINALFVQFSRTQKIERADLEGAYGALKTRAGNTDYKVRHISVASEADAKAILAELAKGEKFEVLARRSTDPVTRERGGEIGWINGTSNLPPAVFQAVSRLQKGKVAEAPVATPNGYQILLLEDTRPLVHPTFEQVAGQIGQQMLQERFRQYLAGLRAKAKIE